MQQGYTNGNNTYWSFQQIVDEFPSISPPNFGLLLVMFIIYMIVVAPVLYLVLRRVDKREWSWWLIPLISIICGAAIFFFGAENKRFMSTHSVQRCNYLAKAKELNLVRFRFSFRMAVK